MHLDGTMRSLSAHLADDGIIRRRYVNRCGMNTNREPPVLSLIRTPIRECTGRCLCETPPPRALHV